MSTKVVDELRRRLYSVHQNRPRLLRLLLDTCLLMVLVRLPHVGESFFIHVFNSCSLYIPQTPVVLGIGVLSTLRYEGMWAWSKDMGHYCITITVDIVFYIQSSGVRELL